MTMERDDEKIIHDEVERSWGGETEEAPRFQDSRQNRLKSQSRASFRSFHFELGLIPKTPLTLTNMYEECTVPVPVPYRVLTTLRSTRYMEYGAQHTTMGTSNTITSIPYKFTTSPQTP